VVKVFEIYCPRPIRVIVVGVESKFSEVYLYRSISLHYTVLENRYHITEIPNCFDLANEVF
jgi:hypothetical protein